MVLWIQCNFYEFFLIDKQIGATFSQVATWTVYLGWQTYRSSLIWNNNNNN